MSTSRPPDIIYVISVPKPSPFFSHSSASMYYTPKSKNRGGLGMTTVSMVSFVLRNILQLKECAERKGDSLHRRFIKQ